MRCSWVFVTLISFSHVIKSYSLVTASWNCTVKLFPIKINMWPSAREHKNHSGTFSAIYIHISYTFTSMAWLLVNFKLSFLGTQCNMCIWDVGAFAPFSCCYKLPVHTWLNRHLRYHAPRLKPISANHISIIMLKTIGSFTYPPPRQRKQCIFFS